MAPANSIFNNPADRTAFWQVLGAEDRGEPGPADLAEFAKAAPQDHRLYHKVLIELAKMTEVTHEKSHFGGKPLGSVLRHVDSPARPWGGGLPGSGSRGGFPGNFARKMGYQTYDPAVFIRQIAGYGGSEPFIYDVSVDGRRVRFMIHPLDNHYYVIIRLAEDSMLSFAIIEHRERDLRPLMSLNYQPARQIVPGHWGVGVGSQSLFLYISKDGDPVFVFAVPDTRNAKIRVLTSNAPPANQVVNEQQALQAMMGWVQKSGAMPYDPEMMYKSLSGSAMKTVAEVGEGKGVNRLVMLDINPIIAVHRLNPDRSIDVAFVGYGAREPFLSAIAEEGETLLELLQQLAFVRIEKDHGSYGYLRHPDLGLVVVAQSSTVEGHVAPDYFFNMASGGARRLTGPGTAAMLVRGDGSVVVDRLVRDRGYRDFDEAGAIAFLNGLSGKGVTIVEKDGRNRRYVTTVGPDYISVLLVEDGQSLTVAFLRRSEFDAIQARSGNVMESLRFYPVTMVAGRHHGIVHPEYGTILAFLTGQSEPAFIFCSVETLPKAGASMVEPTVKLADMGGSAVLSAPPAVSMMSPERLTEKMAADDVRPLDVPEMVRLIMGLEAVSPWIVDNEVDGRRYRFCVNTNGIVFRVVDGSELSFARMPPGLREISLGALSYEPVLELYGGRGILGARPDDRTIMVFGVREGRPVFMEVRCLPGERKVRKGKPVGGYKVETTTTYVGPPLTIVPVEEAEGQAGEEGEGDPSAKIASLVQTVTGMGAEPYHRDDVLRGLWIIRTIPNTAKVYEYEDGNRKTRYVVVKLGRTFVVHRLHDDDLNLEVAFIPFDEREAFFAGLGDISDGDVRARLERLSFFIIQPGTQYGTIPNSSVGQVVVSQGLVGEVGDLHLPRYFFDLDNRRTINVLGRDILHLMDDEVEFAKRVQARNNYQPFEPARAMALLDLITPSFVMTVEGREHRFIMTHGNEVNIVTQVIDGRELRIGLVSREDFEGGLASGRRVFNVAFYEVKRTSDGRYHGFRHPRFGFCYVGLGRKPDGLVVVVRKAVRSNVAAKAEAVPAMETAQVIPPAVTERLVPKAIAQFGRLRPPAVEIPIRIGNTTTLNAFFLAAERPLPVHMRIRAGGQSYRDFKAMGELKVPVEVDIRWGWETATPVTYSMTGRRGRYVLESTSAELPGRLEFIDDASGKKVLIPEAGSAFAGWLDDGLYGPWLEAGEERAEDGSPVLIVRGDPADKALFQKVRQNWESMARHPKYGLKVSYSEKRDAVSGSVTGVLRISYPADRDGEMAANIGGMGLSYEQSIRGDARTLPVWKPITLKRRPEKPPEPVVKTIRRAVDISTPADKDAPKSVELEMRRTTLAGNLVSMSIEAVRFCGEAFPSENLIVTLDGKPLALSQPTTFPVTLHVARRTTIPPGKEHFSISVDSEGNLRPRGDYQLAVMGGDGILRDVRVERRPEEFQLTAGLEGSAKGRMVITRFTAPDGSVCYLALEAPMLRGQVASASNVRVTLNGKAVTWPVNVSVENLPLGISAVYPARRGRDAGWEFVDFNIGTDGRVHNISASFVPGSERVRKMKIGQSDPFSLEFETTNDPIRGLELTSAKLFPSAGTRLALSISSEDGIGPITALPRRMEPGSVVGFRVSQLGTVEYEVTPDGTTFTPKATSALLSAAWDIERTAGRAPLLQGIAEGRDRNDFLLPPLNLVVRRSVDGQRFFVRGEACDTLLSILGFSGTKTGFDRARHTEIEVAPRGSDFDFIPVAVDDGVAPVRKVSLKTRFLGNVATAIEQAVGGATEVATTPVGGSFLRFLPGEVFVPTEATLQMLRLACQYREKGPAFTDGSLYWYELEAMHSGVVLRIPVRWRQDRPARPFEIDSSQFVYVRLRGEDPSRAIAITDKRFQAHDNGGNWQIYFLTGDYGPSRVMEFEINAVTSPLSQLVVGAVNILDENGRSSDRDAHIKEAGEQRDVSVAGFLAGRSTTQDLPQFARMSASVSADNRAVFRFASSTAGESAELSGIVFDRGERRLVFDEVVALRFGGQTLTLYPVEAWGGRDGIIHLAEHPSGRPGRVFVWNMGLGSLFAATPLSSVSAASDLADLLGRNNFPSAPSFARSSPLLVPDRLSPQARFANGADARVPIITAGDQGFAWPDFAFVRPPSETDRIEALAGRLCGETFVPVEESLYAELLTGRRFETMTFMSTSGALLQIPMQLSDSPGLRYRPYAEGASSRWSRLIIPDPEVPGRYIDLQAVFHERMKAGGSPRIELVVVAGLKQVPLFFDRASTTQTLNHRPAFGLFAVNGEGNDPETRSRTNARLRELLEFLGLNDKAESLEASPANSGLNVSLPDGRTMLLFLDQRRGPAELDGVQFEDGPEGLRRAYILYDDGKKMELTRAPGGGALYYLRSEGGERFTMVVGDDGNFRFWPRRPGIRHFLTAPEAHDFEMVGLEGHAYQSGAKSVATRIRTSPNGNGGASYEVRAVLGRSEGATASGLTFEWSTSPRIRFQFAVHEDGRIEVERVGEIQQEGNGKAWKPADVEMEERDGRIIVYVRGREIRQRGFRDYAWIEFENSERLAGPDFGVARAHYNMTKMAQRQRMPSEGEVLPHRDATPSGGTAGRRGNGNGSSAGTTSVRIVGTRGPQSGSGGPTAHSKTPPIIMGGRIHAGGAVFGRRDVAEIMGRAVIFTGGSEAPVLALDKAERPTAPTPPGKLRHLRLVPKTVHRERLSKPPRHFNPVLTGTPAISPVFRPGFNPVLVK